MKVFGQNGGDLQKLSQLLLVHLFGLKFNTDFVHMLVLDPHKNVNSHSYGHIVLGSGN